MIKKKFIYFLLMTLLLQSTFLNPSFSMAEEENLCQVQEQNERYEKFRAAWQETGIGIDDFKEKVNHSLCNNDPATFAACIFAIQNLASYTGAPAKLGFFSNHDLELRKNDIFNDSNGQPNIRKIGSFFLVQLKPEAKDLSKIESYGLIFKEGQSVSLKEFYEKRNEALFDDLKMISDSFSWNGDASGDNGDTSYKMNSISDAKNLFDSVKRAFSNRVINFDTLINLLASNISSEKMSMAVADSINLYLKVAFDGHTQISPGTIMKQMLTESGENYAGIGLVIGTELDKNKNMVKVFGFQDSSDFQSPASLSGLKVGDQIVSINGKSVIGKMSCQVSSLIMGSVGAPVKIGVQRSGEKNILEFQVTRRKIIRDNIILKQIQYQGSPYVYIKLLTFSEVGLFHRLMKMLESKNIDLVHSRGVILDLRGNPGGDLNEVSYIASLFIGSETPVYGQVSKLDLSNPNFQINWFSAEKLFQATKEDFNESGGNVSGLPDYDPKILLDEVNKYLLREPTIKKPVVILIDESSASGSELISGSLRDHKIALTVGERTFGKGSMQGLMVRGTVAKPFNGNGYPPIYFSETERLFFQPNGTTNQQVGIEADFKVHERPDLTDEKSYHPREAEVEPLSISSLMTEPSPSPLQDEIKYVKSCVNEDFVKSRFYQSQKSLEDIVEVDYQKYYGLEVLKCFADLREGANGSKKDLN